MFITSVLQVVCVCADRVRVIANDKWSQQSAFAIWIFERCCDVVGSAEYAIQARVVGDMCVELIENVDFQRQPWR